MFRSIRWSLLFWYALILIGVLGTFSGVLYYKLYRTALRGVDAELTAHAQAIAAALEPIGKGHYQLELPDEYQKYFSQEDPEAPYMVIWSPAGEAAIESKKDLGKEIPRPEGPGVRTRKNIRESVVMASRGKELVLVGKDVGEIHERLEEFLWQVIAVASVVLVVALGGGWFLAGRVLRPIDSMSETASQITANNLSGRIDVAGTKSELGELAATLNETFDRLGQAFERQTRFTADASHELRTPLSILMSHCELALKKDRTAPEYRETIETALKAAQRMKAVVEGLLTLARADAREINLQRERTSLKKIVEETASMLGPMAMERKVGLTVSADEVDVVGDRERLREVVLNLVTNAIRYNREGGKVDVTLQRDDGNAILTVADTGIGIPERDVSHIFERFYRVDKARSREMGGSGLGLSITKWVVEAHGGSISFTSREGEGTSFVVRLCRAE